MGAQGESARSALGHHRFQWLYVTAFVGPATGETVWYLTDTVSKPLFAGLLDAFAREVGAGPHKARRAAARQRRLAHPDQPRRARRLVYLPPYSPVQPAETLWTWWTNLVNTFVPNRDKLIDTITRCSNLTTRLKSVTHQLRLVAR